MQHQDTGFIGGGNMARSIIGGLLTAGETAPEPASIIVSEPDAARRTHLAADFGVRTTGDNNEAAAHAALLVLAVKPNTMAAVSREIAATVRAGKPLVISIAAGVLGDDIREWLGGAIPVVRVMPNTPALVNHGASALFANAQCDAHHRQSAERVMGAVGITAWVDDERLLDPITALSGCGPAYFFRVLELMSQSAIESGVAPETARAFALQTALGTALLAEAERDGAGFAELQRRVTSPGGATERALEIMEREGFAHAFSAAMRGATERSRELAAESRAKQ